MFVQIQEIVILYYILYHCNYVTTYVCKRTNCREIVSAPGFSSWDITIIRHKQLLYKFYKHSVIFWNCSIECCTQYIVQMYCNCYKWNHSTVTTRSRSSHWHCYLSWFQVHLIHWVYYNVVQFHPDNTGPDPH